jgi:hypothetical protein
MVRKENPVLTIVIVGSLLTMGGVLCAIFFDPRPIGGRNMAILKFGAKNRFLVNPKHFSSRLGWENTEK